MICEYCRTELVNTYVCPNCGKTDAIAKKIIYASNRHYNQGLEKTKVRDLTGARNSLLMSLKFNKRNTQARNLLGLVYYHSGEFVNALGEWVISVHFQPEDNAAATYIREIQNNPGKLQTANRIIRKYNKSIVYARQGNMDKAIIELKKVINLNPDYVRAYQLLGLLYFQTKQYSFARRVLVRSLKVDRNNVTSLRYIKEIDAAAGGEAREKAVKTEEQLQIRDPNPVVIEEKKDLTFKDFNTGLLSFVNVVIGVIIGAAVIWFLIVPQVKQTQTETYNRAVVEYSSKISENSKLISSYENENADLQEQVEALSEQLEAVQTAAETSDTDDWLYLAMSEYIAGNNTQAGLYLAEIDSDTIENDAAQDIYDTLCELTKSKAISSLSETAEEAFEDQEYTDAIETYEKLLNLDADDTEAIYAIGQCYQKLADLESASEYYTMLVESYPDSDEAALAEEALSQIAEEASGDDT